MWTIVNDPPKLSHLSDDEILRDALARYRRASVPVGSCEFYVHSADMAEYNRRADRAEAMLAEMG
jgi:hypothetical protein